MPNVVELREEIAEKRRFLHNVFQEAGPEVDLTRVTVLTGDTQAKHAEIRRRNLELDALSGEEARLALLEEIARKNAQEHERLTQPERGLPFGSANGSAGKGGPPPSFREFLSGHPQYKAFRDGHAREATIDLPHFDFKTLVTLTTVSPQNFRQPDVVPMAQEERTVADLLLQGTISVGTIEYYEETLFTNTAGPVAEGAAKPEMTLEWTLRSDPARKIAETIPATKESLDDVSWLESQLRNRLAFAVKRAEEAELLAGDGTGVHLLGLLNRPGVQTIAKGGTEPNTDAIYKAIQLVRGSAGLGFAEPTAIVMHPQNVTNYKLMRTADGIYINGPPSQEGPDTMWGLPIRQTTGMTLDKALVLTRQYGEVLRREGITLTMSTEHSTFFVENKVMFLAEERLALAVYRPSAFATATALSHA